MRVRVPATTANIGPGFDALGCALSLYNTFTFEKTDAGLEITGCPAQYATADNLCYRAYADTCARLGVSADGVRIDIESNVPLARGLGSSATCLAAGAMAANALHGDRLSRAELLDVCTALEGHPDNVAPALYGNLTAAFMHEGHAMVARYAIHPDVRFFALIPEFELSTHAARAALPKAVDFADAVFNVSHTAALLRGLETGDAALIGAALRDRLHQPYRKALIPGYDAVTALAQEAGAYAVFLSGAGPTIMALAGADFPERAGRLAQMPGGWRIVTLRVDAEGATIL